MTPKIKLSKGIIFAATFFVAALPQMAQADTMTDIGATLGGANTRAYGVSGDGGIIAGRGQYDINLYHGFTYSAGNIAALPTLGGDFSAAYGISGDGLTVLGETTDGSNNHHAVKYVGGVATDLGTLGGTDSAGASAASYDGSIIVGSSAIAANAALHAFKYSLGAMTDLGTLGGNASLGESISSDGAVIIGESQTSGSTNYQAFKYSDSIMTGLGTLGGDNSYAFGISDDKTIIVGQSQALGSTNYHAFKYSDMTMSDLGTLGGSGSEANGISGNGAIIIGDSKIAGDAATHAFKYINGTMYDLGTLGGTNSRAFAISNDGKVIVGESDITGSTDVHSFIVNVASTTTVDINNTAVALGNNAIQLNSIFNLNNTLLYTTLNQDATLFGKNNISIEVGGRYANIHSANNADSSKQIGGTLKIAYRFNPHLRAGVFLDQSLSNNMPNNFSMQNSTPMIGIFTTLTQKTDGTGAQLRLAAAYNSADLTITRSVLTNSEAGRGKTNLVSQGALAEVGYGFALSENLKLQPYFGLRFMQITRDGYVENSGADFPISFQKAEKKSTTAFVGTRLSAAITADLQSKFSVGYEHDLISSLDGYAGNISYLGSFNLTPNNVRKNRAFASAGLSYDVAKLQTIGADLFYTKQSLSGANGAVVYLHYTIGF